MSKHLYKCLEKLATLSPTALHQSNREYRLQLASAEWLMCVSLLASERMKLYRELEGKKYPDLISYAEDELDLARQKTLEMLSTARAMERLPLMSDAFREGRLSWAKVRELKRVATPETEKVWVDFAVGTKVATLQRRVAVSPAEWKRGQALTASIQGQPVATPTEVGEILREPQLKLEQAATIEGPPALPAPKFVRVVLHLTADEYAAYQQAEARVRSRHNKTLRRESVIMEWANGELSGGTAQARARHQVVIHTVPDSEVAWYETDRGLLPADPELVAETRKAGREIALDAGIPEPTSPGKSKERYISNAVMRFIFARAGNRCECCRRSGCQLDVHHKKPVSDGGGNRPEDLLVLCKVCHALMHEEDFEYRLDWIQTRAWALKRGSVSPDLDMIGLGPDGTSMEPMGAGVAGGTDERGAGGRGGGGGDVAARIPGGVYHRCGAPEDSPGLPRCGPSSVCPPLAGE